LNLKDTFAAARDAVALKAALCVQYAQLKFTAILQRGVVASYPTFLLSMAFAVVFLYTLRIAEAVARTWRDLVELSEDFKSLSYRAWRDDYRRRTPGA